MSIEKKLIFAADQMRDAIDAEEYKNIARVLLFLHHIAEAFVRRHERIAKEVRPVSLVMDAPLVYSDDRPLDVIVDILGEAAIRLQLTVRTCHEFSFGHDPGNRISFGPFPA